MTQPKRLYRVLSVAGLQKVFGRFSYTEAGGGAVKIDPSWVADNIVSCTLVRARNGRDVKTRCHRLAKEPFERLHAEIADSGLWKLIHTWDGLWVPRHRTWNTRRPLSSHSWGVAEDLNAATNPFGGQVTDENRALAAVFIKYGFDWGGFWSPRQRDGMHYELVDPDAYKQVEEKEPQLILAIKRPDNSLHYVRIETGKFKPGQFTVEGGEVARYLNASWPSEKPKEVPVAQAIADLGWQIFERGDHLSDKANPRYYLFLQPAK
jgi:hypothetical protein